MKKIIKIFLLLLLIPLSSFSQTCCSGGVPVSGNLGLPSSEANTLQFNLSYDFNNLNTLKTERTVLDDNSRKRTTHSFLIETGYSFTNRFSVDAFFSFIRQERLINNNDFTFTQGVGDMVLLAKYALFINEKKGSSLTIGAGAKLPIGASDKNNSKNGLALNADLQPGSGATDWVGWAEWNRTFKSRPSMSISSNLIYSYKGINTSYLGDNDYQFGQEVSWAVGLGDQFFIAKNLLNLSIQLRYRKARADFFNQDELPSTGGDWIFFNSGVAYWWTPNFALETNIELPILASVEGTQVTPTVRLKLGLFYKIKFKDNNNNIPTKILN